MRAIRRRPTFPPSCTSSSRFSPATRTSSTGGCGTGRDSRNMLDMGLRVTSVDASEAMCETARDMFDIEARRETFDQLAAEEEYDGIWACASLLHVGKSDLPRVLEKARNALKEGGILYASFKYGRFEGMRGGRWFTDLDEDALQTLVVEGLSTERVWITQDVRPGRSEEKWLNCLLRKCS